MPSNPDHSLNVFSRRLISVSRVEATNYSANDIDNDREITFKGCTLVDVKKPCGFPAEVGDGIRNTNPRFFPLSSYHYKYFFRRLSASIFNWAFNCGVRINFPFFQCTLHRLIHSRKKKAESDDDVKCWVRNEHSKLLSIEALLLLHCANLWNLSVNSLALKALPETRSTTENAFRFPLLLLLFKIRLELLHRFSTTHALLRAVARVNRWEGKSRRKFFMPFGKVGFWKSCRKK